MKPRFEFYEVVQVRSGEKAGVEGAIMGRAQGADGTWNYSVHLYSVGTSWYFREHELEATGRMDRRESFYDGDTITVQVDPDTGEGRVI